MINSGDTLDDKGTTEVDVAIVGAGPVGIAIATRIAGKIGRVALIEAGDTKFSPAQNIHYFQAESVECSRHLPTELNRRRMLGGTSTVWGGRCIPFNIEDFAPTSQRSGWPFPFSEIASQIPSALAFLDGGLADFSARSAQPAHPFLLDGSSGDLELDQIERYSKPTNIWRKWGPILARSRDLRVIFGASATRVITDPSAGRAIGLDLRTEAGRSHKLLASTIVLACGGLETPRLLLASPGNGATALGNENDLVGRFYMGHLVSSARTVGTLRFAKPEMAHAFDYNRTSDAVYSRRMILLSPEARKRDSLPNIVFRPTRPPIDDAAHENAVLSAMFLVRNLFIPAEYARSLVAGQSKNFSSPEWRHHVANVMTDLPQLLKFGSDWITRRVLADRKLPSVFLYRSDGVYPLEFNAEQLPDPNSRVQLGDSLDPLGMPRLLVQWRFGKSELAAICQAYRVLAASAARAGLGEVRFDEGLTEAIDGTLVPQGGHHIGTVRMDRDSRTGVVDPQGELWHMKGVFVAGSATFPTSGIANPTLTAVAMSLRLAEHLISRHGDFRPR